MATEHVAEVFIEVTVGTSRWTISKEYADALKPHMSSIPTSFFLPWHSPVVPRRGEEIALDRVCVTHDTLTVRRIDHRFDVDNGHRVFVVSEFRQQDHYPLNDDALLSMAREGFLAEDHSTPLKAVLEEAGLWPGE